MGNDRIIREESIGESNSKRLGQYNPRLSIAWLVPFTDHPFKLYEGIPFASMVESIKENGVMIPIIVRIIDNNEYEILSGHNRVNAAKEARLSTIPAIVYENLTDNEAKLIVTETNLIQRSFSDMAHSEKAAVISMQYEAMKQKSGYRMDLLQEIDELTSAPVGRRLESRDKVGKEYGLKKTTISRYLRISKLTSALKDRLDNDEIAIRTAVSLSYLRMEEQEVVAQLLQSDNKISMKQAETLRKKSSKGELNREAIEQILAQAPAIAKSVKISKELCSQYFKDEKSSENIERIIAEALEMYFSKNG